VILDKCRLADSPVAVRAEAPRCQGPAVFELLPALVMSLGLLALS